MKDASLIFWDFDGVIKDSVFVKTKAYVSLFEDFGSILIDRIRKHHGENGGMSRLEKIPLYLQWAGIYSCNDLVQEYCDRFSRQVLQQVLDSPWVPGVERYLRSHCHRQRFFLISATPQQELEHIVQALDLTSCFESLFGAPVKKIEAIRGILLATKLEPRDCLMIGDAQADLDAAVINNVPFILRKYSGNYDLFSNYRGSYIEDFSNL